MSFRITHIANTLALTLLAPFFNFGGKIRLDPRIQMVANDKITNRYCRVDQFADGESGGCSSR